MKALFIFVLLAVAASIAFAQQDLPTPDMFLRRVLTSSASVQPRSERPMYFRIPGKKASQYTPLDWGIIIDSTWGPGQSAAEQLQIFDTFWDLVRQRWAGFPNLALNCSYWDSVANVYRPQIGSGLSRGRFYALMSRMWLALSELHTFIRDPRVDETFGRTTFQYRPGVPLLCVGPYLGNMLGAAVTPLADSTNLVYRVAPDNRLGLEPGDLVLGYDGIPWKRLYRQLLDAGLPVSYYYSFNGSTPESKTHFFLMAVGLNWGLFDTIDVVKFSSGDTLHIPTARLDTTHQTVWPSEQVSIAGVPMPQAPWGSAAVSWGVVQGTNTGYVYVWDWNSLQTALLFQNAVDDLVHIRRVKGLVLDFRMNWGGNFTIGNNGLRQLFNFDPTSNLATALRNSVVDCMSFTFPGAPGAFTPGALYDHPIAVLIGPGAFSVGDYNALRMRFHPMARLFGKPTDGAFVAGSFLEGTLSGNWRYLIPTNTVYSNVSGEGHLIHKGVQPDEEVWLTRAGVANGQDDVVKRALAWMDSLSYAYDVVATKDTATITPAAQGVMYAASDTLFTINTETGAATRIGWIGPNAMHGLAIRPSTREMFGVSTALNSTVLYRVSTSVASRLTSDNLADSIRITAKVKNPRRHTLIVSAIITNTQGGLVDSVAFRPASGDSIWRALIRRPGVGGTYRVSVRTQDVTDGSYRRLPNVTSFAVALTHMQRTIPIQGIRAIAFSRGDTLFGATTSGTLYRISPATGAADSIGTTAGVVYSGLSFRPSNGELWASVRHPISGRDRIYKVNTATGAATLVGATGDGRITPSIVFAPTGVLYGLKSGLPSDTIITIDTNDAVRTTVGLTGVTGLNALTMLLDHPVAVEEHPGWSIPVTFKLEHNYPNPFNPSTTIRYALPQRAAVTLVVYNTLGQEVTTLVRGEKEEGYHEAVFDASGMASGVYFYRLTAGSFVETRKLLLLR